MNIRMNPGVLLQFIVICLLVSVGSATTRHAIADSASGEPLSWEVPLTLDYDDSGSPSNFLGLNGYSVCGDSFFVFVSGKNRSAVVRTISGSFVQSIDLSPILSKLPDVTSLAIECQKEEKPGSVGFVLYSGRDLNGMPNRQSATSALFDLNAREWSGPFSNSHLVASAHRVFVIKTDGVYAFESGKPSLVARLPLQAKDRLVEATVVAKQKERFFQRLDDGDLFCGLINTDQSIVCSDLRKMRLAAEKSGLANVDFDRVIGAEVYISSYDRQLRCKLATSECIEQMICDCRLLPQTQYAVLNDGSAVELTLRGEGDNVPFEEPDRRYLVVRSEANKELFRLSQDVLSKVTLADLSAVRSKLFLILYFEDGARSYLHVQELPR
jgi:hypothetical protein